MKAFTKFLSIFIFAPVFSFASTIISGPTASGHWTLAGSPYLIQNSVYIPNDSTLLIDPGVTVNFQTTFTPYMHVLGRLIAVGTALDSIYFTATDTTDGFHGIRFYGIKYNNDTSKLEYCKIQYGKANGSNYYVQNGGALLFDNWSKAIVSHCYISNCEAYNVYSYGGGIFCDSGSSPILTYNTITRCIVEYFGAGISAIHNSTPLIAYNTIMGNGGGTEGGGIDIEEALNYNVSHNTIMYNSAAEGGGGIIMSSSKGTLAYNTISSNMVYNGPGGGIYDANGDSLSILHNTISYNWLYNQDQTGAGIDLQSTNIANVDDNIIANNYTPNGGNGAGICLLQTLQTTISNNSIINNTALFTISYGAGNGGGIYCNNSSPLIINTTFANNWAYNGGALYCDLASNPVSRNCIYWGDTGTNGGNELFQNDQPSTPNFYYCNVQGGSAAFGLNGNFYYGVYANNINANPVFVSPSGGKGYSFDGVSGDWSLTTGTSPCIDAGDPLTNPYPATDLVGNPRVVVCRIDMGAYENQYGVSSPLQVSISGSNTLCFGDSTALIASGATSYTWSPSAGLSCTNCANPEATPTITTTYTVIGASGICEAMDTITIVVNSLPVLTIGNNLDTLTISGAKTYMWSTGSTNDTTIIHSNGTYYVTGTDSNGCKSVDSIVMVSTTISKPANNSKGVSVYPMPSDGNMAVMLNGNGYISLKIVDELGREVYSQLIDAGKQNQNMYINLKNVANGIYTLQVISNAGVSSKRVIVQK